MNRMEQNEQDVTNRQYELQHHDNWLSKRLCLKQHYDSCQMKSDLATITQKNESDSSVLMPHQGDLDALHSLQTVL